MSGDFRLVTICAARASNLPSAMSRSPSSSFGSRFSTLNVATVSRSGVPASAVVSLASAPGTGVKGRVARTSKLPKA